MRWLHIHEVIKFQTFKPLFEFKETQEAVNVYVMDGEIGKRRQLGVAETFQQDMGAKL